tara:strand:+ start:2415 stop:2717 length:303 start_codon:yes stop_codon:yes gene_type:complete
MNERSKKLEEIIEQNRIKLHIFEPSQREIWTIVGNEKEHWVDSESKFCSCSGFYFSMLKSKQPCYHIDSIDIARKEKKFEVIKFSDDEFDSFISSVLHDL